MIESDGGGTRDRIPALLLSAICAVVLGGILVAGLWPFHTPRNQVSWLRPGNGLLFGNRGSMVSARNFEARRPYPTGACSIEIWLEPGRVDTGGTILAFYWPAKRFVPFVLRQFVSGLELQHRGPEQSSRRTRLYVDGVFSRRRPLWLTITSSQKGTAIYVDGISVWSSDTFKFTGEDLTGQLILGNGPSTSNNWMGQLKTLALYDRELTAGEVSRHFADRTRGELPNLAGSEGVFASYLLNEGNGSVVHNQVDSSPNLLIPERYFVVDKLFLQRPWTEFRFRWSYGENVLINIAGFVPLGFFFYPYLFVVRKIEPAAWLTIVLGLTVSVTIEVLQAFLPTRDSGMTDIMTNTLGTALGAFLCAWLMQRPRFIRADIFHFISGGVKAVSEVQQ
jgi:VanZ like family/Concanavalin A-like lectin/glucanases superfamily